MTRYAAFLRGINLGNRRVKGPELCAPFTALGLENVSSFLASGNVVFDTDGGTGPGELASSIQVALAEHLGYEVLTFLRSAEELAAIAGHAPFPPEAVERSTGKLQVLLLADVPQTDAATAALAHATDDDLLALSGRELYWLPAGGVSQSDLDVDAIGRLIGPVTQRTANTCARLHARFFATT